MTQTISMTKILHWVPWVLVLVLVTGPLGSLATVAPRLDLVELFSPENSKMSNLFLQAMDEMMQLSPTDYRSYYQIAGIHGLPYIPYRDSINESYSTDPASMGGWAGYCQHGSVLFPTWHRAYMLLIEKTMMELSETIAGRYANETLRQEYQIIAEQLRFPYWDWSSNITSEVGVPTILIQETVDVIVPPFGETKTISNPLQGFTAPVDIGKPMGCKGCNPYDTPYEVLSLESGFYPYLPKGYRTVRQPSRENAQTQVEQLQESVKFFSKANWNSAVHAALKPKTWLKFSNHGGNNDGTVSKDRYFFYSSLEAVHNAVHLGVGGWGGQMAYSENAAFDPIFFLQHANVDRLFAEWQEANPNAWIEPNTNPQSTFTMPAGVVVDSKTPLTPFRKGDGSDLNQYYTSDDVRNISDLGYSYNSVDYLRRMPHDQRRKRMLQHYQPNDGLEYRWYVALPHARINSAPEPFGIDVFVGAPYPVNEMHNESDIMKYYGGTFNIWHHTPININNGLKSQSVDITKSMISQDINTVPVPRTVQGNDFSDIDNLFDRARFSIWTADDIQFSIHSLDGRDFSRYVDLGDPLIYFTSEDDDNSTMDDYVRVYPQLEVRDINQIEFDVQEPQQANRRLMESSGSRLNAANAAAVLSTLMYFIVSIL